MTHAQRRIEVLPVAWLAAMLMPSLWLVSMLVPFVLYVIPAALVDGLVLRCRLHLPRWIVYLGPAPVRRVVRRDPREAEVALLAAVACAALASGLMTPAIGEWP
jgi:hypothetical protein